MLHQIRPQRVIAFVARHQGDVAIDALALDVVRVTHDGRFGDEVVRDERRFDFGRAQAVTGDVQDVVHAARDPVVAVFVAPAAVTREILALVGGE